VQLSTLRSDTGSSTATNASARPESRRTLRRRPQDDRDCQLHDRKPGSRRHRKKPAPTQLSTHAQPSISWSAALLGGVLWRGFTHVKTHREVLRFLLKFPPFTEFVFSNPSFTCKYLTQNYLVRGFTVAERATCFLYHYKRLLRRCPIASYARLCKRMFTIHAIPEGANRYALTMGMSSPAIMKANCLSICKWMAKLFIFSPSPSFPDGWSNRRQRRFC